MKIMFGDLKENILDSLEKIYINEGEKPFKKKFHNYIKTIKENKDIKEFYEVYDLFTQVNFDDESIAKEFVEESLSHLKKFNKSEVNKLISLLEEKNMSFYDKDGKWFSSSDKLHKDNVTKHKNRFGNDITFSVYGYDGKYNDWDEFESKKKSNTTPHTLPKPKLSENSIEYKLDQLIFNDKINLKDKVTYKMGLIKQLVNKNKEVSSYKETFDKLQSNINENISNLNDNQSAILDLFIENDSTKINDYYHNLINETTDLVDKKIIESDDLNVAKKLLEVKIKLRNIKNEKPNINEIDKIIELKESFI